jgi:hypothetical protein
MKGKKQHDWKVIEGEFRAGQLSIREIAKNHCITESAIRKKMKALGIERDLTQKVQDRFRSELVRTQVRTADRESEEQIVDQAAANAVGIVRCHRIRIGRAHKVVDTLLSQLTIAAVLREEIEDQIFEETKDDQSPNRQSMMLRAISLPTHASVVQKLSNALKTLIGLERQAYNIMDEAERNESSIIAELKAAMGRIGANPREKLNNIP